MELDYVPDPIRLGYRSEVKLESETVRLGSRSEIGLGICDLARILIWNWIIFLKQLG